MQYNFDEIISRENTNSISYEGWINNIYGKNPPPALPFLQKDYIRLWVADMDFSTPPEVLDAIRARLDRKILGYTVVFDPEYHTVLKNWFLKRYHWAIRTEEIVISPGVVPALNRLVPLLTAENESVLICTPSYAPFKGAADYSQRRIFYSKLKNNSGHYEVDFEDLERQMTDPEKNINLFILCNPHNPSGRIWTEKELREIARICLQNNVWIISDEIHCDLLRKGNHHIPLATLFPESDRIITCTAPSKTFNMAGNLMSHIFIPNAGIRRKWDRLYHELNSPLSIAATKAAYELGEEWLEELKSYLDGNFRHMKERLGALLPMAKFQIPEATYLGWLDLSAYRDKIPEGENFTAFFAKKAGVIAEGGEIFVDNGENHLRINVACPRAILEEGLKRIAKTLNA